MSDKRSISNIPAGVALLLGAGALSLASGYAEAKAQPSGGRVASASSVEGASVGIRLWTQDGRIFLSEAAGEPRELALVAGQQRQKLVELLERAGASMPVSAVSLPRILLAGGGGDGFHFAPPRNPNADTSSARPENSTNTRGSPSPESTGPLQNANEAASVRRR